MHIALDEMSMNVEYEMTQERLTLSRRVWNSKIIREGTTHAKVTDHRDGISDVRVNCQPVDILSLLETSSIEPHQRPYQIGRRLCPYVRRA